ncbi:Bax inhibitor-1/YccA family protein [Nocardioides sp.]|uniref:Bax inhibitor-1/YccA family protein n=1 Tax=Nocardioides sp. TaxID=35761 RepID=UPI002ED57B4C
MQSNNPVFRNSDAFNGSGNAYGNQTYPGNGAGYDAYGQQAQPGYADTYAPAGAGERMTVDSVVQKTGIALAVVIVTAALTWWFTGDIDNEENAGLLFGALAIGSLGAFALSMVNSFKRVISPPLVLAFCALEGVALGAFSKFIDATFVDADSGNIVMQAVIGTFAAFAGTLAAYKFFNIKVGQRFRTFVIAAMFGMVALAMLEVVLSLFGNAVGFLGFGNLGLLFSIAGLVLGVFMLILDFDFVEKGVAAGIPERESWRAAFALTVSLVWIYTNLLRILAIFSSD